MDAYKPIPDRGIDIEAKLPERPEKIIKIQVSEGAALQATSGKFSIVRKRIKKVSNCDLEENLGSIIELRNEIVHEAVEPEISEDEVIDTYKNMEKMLYEIGKKAIENGIEIKDDLELLSEKQSF